MEAENNRCSLFRSAHEAPLGVSRIWRCRPISSLAAVPRVTAKPAARASIHAAAGKTSPSTYAVDLELEVAFNTLGRALDN